MNAKPMARLVILAIVSVLGLAACQPADDENAQMLQADAYLGVAQLYRTQGQFRAAIIEAQNSLQAFPGYEKTQRFIAGLQIDMGNDLAAQEILQSLLTVYPDDPELKLLLAESLLNTGSQNVALTVLENFESAVAADQAQASWIQGNAHARNNNIQRAQEFLNTAIELEPNHLPSLISLSMLEFQTGNEFGAQEFLDRALAVDASDVDVQIWNGQFALLRQQYPAAEAAFFNALQTMGEYDTMTPKQLAVLRAIIVPLQMQQKNDEALRYSQIIAESPQGQLQNSYTSAISLFQEGDFGEAEQAISAILAQAPDHAGSNILLGLTRYAQGNFQGAEDTLAGLVDAETSSPEVVKILAATHLRLGHADRALSVLSEASAIYPEDGSLLAMEAISHQNLGNIEQSIELFERAMELQTESADLHFALAGSYFMNEQVEPSIQQLERTLEIDPNYDLAKATLVNMLQDLERNDEARAYVNRWLQADSNSIGNNNVAGRLEFRQGNFDAANAYFNTSLGIDPENVEASLFIARIAIQEDNFAIGEERLRQVLANNPGNLEALSGFLAIGDLNQTVAEKVAEVERMIDEQPSEFIPALVLAQYHFSKREFDRALAPAETAYGRNVNTYTTNTLLEILAQLANAARGEEDIELARQYTRTAMDLAPDNLQILILAAGVEAQAGAYSASLLYIDRIKQLQPAGATLGTELEGDLAVQQLEYERALTLFQQAWETTPNPALGVKVHRTFAELDRDDEALAFLNEWVTQFPEEPAVNLLLGMTYQESGDDSTAVEAYEVAYSAEPDNIVVLNNLAWLYQDSNPERALELASRAAELYANNADVLDTYGWILLKQNNKDHAIQVLERALELAPASQAIAEHLEQARQ